MTTAKQVAEYHGQFVDFEPLGCRPNRC